MSLFYCLPLVQLWWHRAWLPSRWAWLDQSSAGTLECNWTRVGSKTYRQSPVRVSLLSAQSTLINSFFFLLYGCVESIKTLLGLAKFCCNPFFFWIQFTTTECKLDCNLEFGNFLNQNKQKKEYWASLSRSEQCAFESNFELKLLKTWQALNWIEFLGKLLSDLAEPDPSWLRLRSA